MPPEILLVGLAAGVLALAIARGSVFEPLRARLTGWPGELVRCPLCLSAWLCGALWLTQGVPDGVSPDVAWGASWAVATAYAAAVERVAGE